jgi:hypothetical protein
VAPADGPKDKRKIPATAFALIAGLSFAPATCRGRHLRTIIAASPGPFAVSGTPIVNGMADYLNTLIERDGGIAAQQLPEKARMHFQRAPGHDVVEHGHAAKRRCVLKRVCDTTTAASCGPMLARVARNLSSVAV